MLMNILYPLLVIFGIGLVIFVHELGHFLAARAVGIRVEAFSIGFGKKIWGFRKGDTEYKVCLFPLGGYVKMAGEDPTHPTTGAPDEFGSKTVWQRTLVISAGVIMNMVFAVVALPIAFSFGVPFDVPVLGDVEPEGPAWRAGLHRGDRVVEINGDPVLSFEDIRTEVAVSNGPLELVIERQGRRRPVKVEPRAGQAGFPVIGVLPSLVAEFELAPELFEGEQGDDVARRRARALKEAGLQPGDILKGLNGIPADRFRLWNLEIDRVGDKPLNLLVRRKDELFESSVQPVMADVPGTERWIIGVIATPKADVRVRAVVPGDPADRMGLRPGDRIAAIDGRPFTSAGDLALAVGHGHDPRRTALLGGFPEPPPWPSRLTFSVQREGAVDPVQLSLDLPTREDRVAFLESFTVAAELSRRVRVEPGLPAARAGMQTGDLILAIDDQQVKDFQDLSRLIGAAEGRPLSVRVQRGDAELTLQVTPVWKAQRKNLVLRGVRPAAGLSAVVTENVRYPFPESVGVGFIYAGRMLKRVVKTLRSIFRGSVSARNLGGPITIFQASYQYSKVGIMRGLLFMAVISINLAILNILPIPILDGGWLVFLIIEKVKGSPISERTLGYLQWMGLILILALMVFVTWNDIQRLMAQWFQ